MTPGGVSTFCSPISRYTEKISDVELEDTVTCIRFVKLDCSPLKASLVHHCNDWQTRLTELLTRMACTGLQDLHNSMHSNAEKWVLLRRNPLRDLET